MSGALPDLGPTSSSGPDAYWPLRAEARPFQSTVYETHSNYFILERAYTECNQAMDPGIWATLFGLVLTN